MTIEERLRVDLHSSPLPDTLVPPVGLADTVLDALHRRRRVQALLAVAAVVLLAVGVPVALPRGGGPASSVPATAAARMAVHVYTVDGGSTSYLLDTTAGRYQKLPFAVVLSPDHARVAVVDNDGRIGLADRQRVLRDGAAAVRWLDVPPANGPLWSPDGSALLSTSISKSDRAVAFTAHRYDIATGRITDTPITVDFIGSSVGWAADSRRYLALLRDEGVLQHINPDASLGSRIEIRAGVVGGADAYSPSRRYLFADASGLMTQPAVPSPIVDLTTGQAVAAMSAGTQPIGWYDERTVARLADGSTLELVDIASGAVTERGDLRGLPPLSSVQIGSAEGVAADSAALIF